MAAEPARLLDLADAVANGRSVDWLEAESSAGSEDDRALIQQLRLLAGVADIHRADDDHAQARPADPLIGARWGALEIKELIGSGSFGSVYRAHDVQLDREVALKLLRGTALHLQGDEVLREGRLLAKIRHPHVVTVYGADRIDGRVGLWMEFVRGRTLEETLRQNGPLGAKEAALIGVDLCGALAAVHAQGLLHRDIKAQNVMREDGGRMLLMDFGAGRERASLDAADAVGTPLYMATEVLFGSESSPQSDLYSLGVLLFRLVTGRYPVGGRTSDEVKAAHQRGDRAQLRELRPDLPAWFVSAVNRCLAPSPANRFAGPAELETALTGHRDAPASVRNRIAIGVAAISILATVGVGVWSRFSTARSAPSAASPATTRSIGVRPMKNLTGDASQDYFAAGLTDGLLAQLGAIKALRVRAVIEAGSGSPPADLYAWLEGSVQRSGGRVRVAARLVQVAGGDLLWGKSYEGTDAELFMLQSQMAADVARDLNVSLTDTESRRLTRRYVAIPKAQDAYLRGRYLLDQDGRDALTKARDEFQTAIKLDPNYANAYAGLATAYIEMVTAGLLTPEQARALAPPAADSAVQKDPLLAEAVLARAEVRFRLDWDWEGASADYRLAIELNQSDMGARSRYVRYLAAKGELQESERQAREALTIDPLGSEMHALVGMVLLYEERYPEAVNHYLERPGDRLAGNMGLARAYAGARRYPEAIDELRLMVKRGTGDPAAIQSDLARTLAEAGQTAEARRILQQLIARRTEKKDYVAPQDLAYIYVALGEHGTAFELLNAAVDERASRLLWLGVDPRVAPLRTDPRFSELLGRLGIVRGGR